MASFFEAIYYLILNCLAFAIISSNSFCIFVLRRVKSINDAPKILMMSLALADLLTGVIGVLPMVGLSLFTDANGLMSFSSHPLCIIIAVLMKSSYIIKLFSLLALNLDRYVAVTKALSYHTIMTYKMTLTATIITWVFSLFTSAVNGFGIQWKNDVESLKLCIFTATFDNPVFWMEIFFLAVVPFLETVVIYIRLAALARHHAAQIAVIPQAGILPQQNGEGKKKQAALKASKTFGIMTLVFAMSWLPLFVTSVLAKWDNNEMEWLKRFCLLLTFCSGFCNIMVYFKREKEFLKATNAILIPKVESCQQFLAPAMARLKQFCCSACIRARKDSTPIQSTMDDTPCTGWSWHTTYYTTEWAKEWA